MFLADTLMKKELFIQILECYEGNIIGGHRPLHPMCGPPFIVEESALNPPIFPSFHVFYPNLYKVATCYSYTFLSTPT